MSSGRSRSTTRAASRSWGWRSGASRGSSPLSTLGSVLFGALTVADAWVLGWATDHVVAAGVPRRRGRRRACSGRSLALFVGVAMLRAVGIVARRLGRRRSCSTACRPTTGARSPASTSRCRWSGTSGTRPAQLLSNANSDVEAAWGPIAPLPMAVGTVAMMVIAVAQMLARRRGAGGRRPAGLPRGDRHQPRLPAPRLAADDPGPGAARRGQRDRPRVLRRRHGRQDAGPRGGGDRALRREGPRAARRQHPRRPDPRGLRPDARGAAEPRRAGRARRRASAGCCAGATDARRRGHGRLPAHDRVLPDPLDRLAAGRVPAQRRRLRPGARGARRRPAR